MIKPLFDNVLVKEEKAEDAKTEGGIIIPGDRKSHIYGEVVAAGPGISTDKPLDVKPGDRVLIRRGGQEIELPEGKFKHINASLIIGVVE